MSFRKFPKVGSMLVPWRLLKKKPPKVQKLHRETPLGQARRRQKVQMIRAGLARLAEAKRGGHQIWKKWPGF